MSGLGADGVRSATETQRSRRWLRISVTSVPLWLFVFAVLLSRAQAAHAASAGELRASAAAIAARVQSERSAGQFSLERQTKAVQELGQLVLGFLDVVDRASLAGNESSEKDALRGAFRAIAQPLQSIYDGKATDLDAMSQKVIDADGDLDALYASPEWRKETVVVSQALYYLNWLNFYGARVSDGAEKKELLEKAEKGFSEFAVGDSKSDLFIESILGRGLCELELSDEAGAERDLKFVLDSKEAAADRKSKAQIALVDMYLRSNNVQKAIDASKSFGTAGGDGAAFLKYLRIRALVLGAKQGGANGDRYRQEALGLMDSLRKQGGTWSQRVEAILAAASAEDPSKWASAGSGTFAQWQLARTAVAKNDCKQAIPLLEQMMKSEEAEAKQRRGDAGYLLAVCQFQAGQPAEAAKALEGVLPSVSKEYQADATYILFKAVEVQVAKSPTPELSEQLRRVATGYVQSFPDHKSAYEAYLRLGEILQGERKFPDAIAMYEKVQGDPLFELRAQFGILQSKFEQLGELQKADRVKRDALLKDIGERLPKVTQAARDIEKKGGDSAASAHEVLGKTVVLEAAYVSFDSKGDAKQNDERVLALLKDYEKTYPNRSELFPSVVKFRLEALEYLDRLPEAEQEWKAHGSVLAGADYTEAREQLAQRYVRASGRAKNRQDEAGAKAAQQLALTLFEMNAGQGDADVKKKLTLARLYQETGETAKAKQIFEEILAQDPNSLVALKSLARLAESTKDPTALQQWQRYAAVGKPGDPVWYDGQYEIARLTLANGDKQRACEILTQVRAAIMGLGDADLRKKLNQLYGEAC